MLDRCRLCGNTDLVIHEKAGSRNQFSYYRCRNCKLVNYDLDGGVNQEKYAEVFIDPLDNSHPVNRSQTESYRFLKRYLPSTGSLLEIGFGNGRILNMAHQDGFQVTGVELSQFLVDSVARHLKLNVIKADFMSETDLGDKRFDIIILIHVLEHFPDSLKVMNRINQLLSPGGLVLIEIPNIDSWELKYKRFMRRHRIYRKKYSSDFVPGHCNEFCKDSFKFLLNKTGFKLLLWKTYSHKPFLNFLYGLFPIGNKARALIQKV